MHKLVYGLGSSLCYHLGLHGKWVDALPKVLKTFDNCCLISTADMSKTMAKLIYETVGQDRLYLDSGGFTLYRKQFKLDKNAFTKECERMKRKFLNLVSLAKYAEIFELDNEYFRVDKDMLSPKNYCREEVKAITGFYPTPVFKMHQGFDYWKRLCECLLYPKLAIGGQAQTRSWDKHRDEFRKMMNYARQCGKKVHLLGCQNVETFKLVKPDTVDYSICQFAINIIHARQMNPNITDEEQLTKIASLYAFAKAKSRSFLYDTNINDEQIEEES